VTPNLRHVTSPKSEGLKYTTQKSEILHSHNKRTNSEQMNKTKQNSIM